MNDYQINQLYRLSIILPSSPPLFHQSINRTDLSVADCGADPPLRGGAELPFSHYLHRFHNHIYIHVSYYNIKMLR